MKISDAAARRAEPRDIQVSPRDQFLSVRRPKDNGYRVWAAIIGNERPNENTAPLDEEHILDRQQFGTLGFRHDAGSDWMLADRGTRFAAVFVRRHGHRAGA